MNWYFFHGEGTFQNAPEVYRRGQAEVNEGEPAGGCRHQRWPKNWMEFQLTHWWDFTVVKPQEVGIESKVKIYDTVEQDQVEYESFQQEKGSMEK